MEQEDDTVVITSAKGFTTIRIVDTSGSHPTLHEVEHAADLNTVRLPTSPGAAAQIARSPSAERAPPTTGLV